MNSPLWHFIKKEFIQLLRDRRMLWVAVGVPIIQLLAFGYVASTDIKHVPTAIFDQSKTYYSRTYLESFKNSGYFDFKYYVTDIKQAQDLLDGGKATVVLRIPSDFSHKVVSGTPVKVQVLVDGSNSSTATVILGYLQQINFSQADLQLKQNLNRRGMGDINLDFLDLRPRVWYNPDLKSVFFMVPAIFALTLLIQTMNLTALSIVKEKEKGTLEQLAVTPLKPYELILGKIIPYALVAFIDIGLITLVATLWFGVILKGSILLLFTLGMIYAATGLGLGVFISTISRTQRQSLMSTIFILGPANILSGFIFPIANMPPFIQAITYLIPVRYFLVIARGIFLKGNGLASLWGDVWPMALFAIIILTLSIVRFRKKLD